MLARGPERDLVALVLGDHGVRLHRVLVDRRELVLALDDDVRAGEDRLELPAVDAVAVADVPVARRELAEAVKETLLGVHLGDQRRAGRNSLVHIGDHRQLLVLDLDRLDPGRSRGRGLGGDGRDLLPVEAHLVDRDDRPVLDRVPVVGIDVGEVGACEYTDDPRDLLRGRGVDRDDAGVRERAAEGLPVQHARNDDVPDELRLAAELLVRVPARVRAPDLGRRLLNRRGHGVASSATASRIPR